MKTATIREVQHGFGRVLARVGRGETVLITKHGKVVAQLMTVPPKADEEPEWPDFEARLRKHFPDGPPSGAPASKLIAESREERF